MKITDPELLSQLNSPDVPKPSGKRITDPALLEQLNSDRYVDMNAGLEGSIQTVQSELDQAKAGGDTKTQAALTRELGKLNKQAGSAPKPVEPPSSQLDLNTPTEITPTTFPEAPKNAFGEEFTDYSKDPRIGMGKGAEFVEGAKRAANETGIGLSKSIRWLAEKAGAKFDPDDGGKFAREEEQLKSYKKFPLGMAGKAGGLATDVATTLIPGVGLEAGLAKAGGPMLARTIGSMAGNAGMSAATAAENKGSAAVGGALGSAVGKYLGHVGAGRSPLGVTPGPDARYLHSRGVTPTLGQSVAEKPGMLPKSINWLEQQSQGVPLFGRSVRAARQRARDQAEAGGFRYTPFLEDTTRPLLNKIPAWLKTAGAAANLDPHTFTGGVALYLTGKGYSKETVQKFMSGALKGPQATELEKLSKEAVTQIGREAGD